ncbi:MAG: hypothetical protein GC153_04935 [Alphaproteobacteria bacterium]|nr:hypothetical protein [Alphaproteobacteria bacterium]
MRAGADDASRIAAGLRRLGATETRSDCYAARIADDLDFAGEEEAARIVENARDREDMKNGVLSASAPVRRAFIAANLRCKHGL